MKFGKVHLSSVEVNDRIYRSHEHPSEHLAKIECALKAIEEITKIEARPRLQPCTDCEYDIIDKMYNELVKRPNGILIKNFPSWFEETFSQTLPDNWRELVETSNKFITETSAVGNIGIVYANEAEEG